MPFELGVWGRSKPPQGDLDLEAYFLVVLSYLYIIYIPIGGRVRELSTQCDSDIMFLVTHLFKVLNWKRC